MAHVIDELIVRLGLDPSKFTKGQREAVDALKKTEKGSTAAVKGIEKGAARTDRALQQTSQHATRTAGTLRVKGKEGAAFFDDLTRAGLKLLGVVTAGKALKAFVSDTMITAAATGRLATNLGMATSALSAYGQMVKQFGGGSATTAEGTAANLLQSLQTFQMTGRPSESLILLSRYLGIGLGQVKGSNFNGLMGDIAHKLHGMAPQRAYAVGHMLGFDDGTINLLRQGRRAYFEHLKTVQQQGVVNKNQADALKKLQTAMAGVEAASKTLGRTLETSVAPGLSTFLNNLTQLLEMLNGNAKTPAERKLAAAMTPQGWANTPEGHWVQKLFMGAGAPLSSKQRAVQRTLMNTLIQGGLSPYAAAGMVGNAMGESSLLPGAHTMYHGKEYVGLFQWSPARRAAILAATGIDVAHATPAQQAKAALWELRHRYPGVLARMDAARSVNQAAAVANKGFEVSAAGGAGIKARERYARNAFGDFYTPVQERAAEISNMLRAARMAAASIAVHQHGNSHSETHVGAINIHTKASDAQGVAHVVRKTVSNAGLAMQANSGLQ